MNKLLLFSYLIVTIQFATSNDIVNTTGIYIAPSNIQYPYGDELQFNVDVLDKDTNPFPCIEHSHLDKLIGKCPMDLHNDTKITKPFIDCPTYALIPPSEGSQISISLHQIPEPEYQCKKCDLRLSTDNTAVIFDCTECFDVQPFQFETNVTHTNTTEQNILYKVFFVEIANYTSPEITETEYFDP